MPAPYTYQNENVIPIQQGRPYSDTITFLNVDGSPYDLSNSSVESQLRKLDGTLAGDFVCTMPDPSSGVIHRELAQEVVDSLTPNAHPTYVWGCLLIDDNNIPETHGGAVVTAVVTEVADGV